MKDDERAERSTRCDARRGIAGPEAALAAEPVGIVVATSHPVNTRAKGDLLWAISGGGGSCGVVTEFEYRLLRLGPDVVDGLVLYPAARARDALRIYRDFVCETPVTLGMMVNPRYVPAAPWIPPELHGAAVITVSVCYAGPVDEALVALGRQKRFGFRLVDTLEPKPYISNERVLDATVPPGWRYYWKSLYVHEQSDEAIDALVAHA